MYTDDDYSCKYCTCPLWRWEDENKDGIPVSPSAYTLIIKEGFLFGKTTEYDLCNNCYSYIIKEHSLDEMSHNISSRGLNYQASVYRLVFYLVNETKSKDWAKAMLKAYELKDKYVPKILEEWEKEKAEEMNYKKKSENKRAQYKNTIKKKIIKLLTDKNYKMPASDIDAHLKFKNVNEIKEYCEELYHEGKIGRTGNYRYFVLTKKTNVKTSKLKTKKIDVKSELKKYKEMLDEGLITQEQYDAKSNKLLDL